MRYCILLLISVSFICFSNNHVNAQDSSRKFIATKATIAPKLDGQLNDAVWQLAKPLDSFVVRTPNFGAKPTANTVVKIIYTDEAVYIGAYLYDNPKEIRKQLTSRDREERQDVDFFGIAFDTYLDRQNAFNFITTSANVQSDARISASNNNDDNNNGADYNWDAVWDSKVAMQKDGWTLEVKIPYMSLRFPKKPVQDWGINFQRFKRSVNEASTWNPINPQTAGVVNQFGIMQGISNIQPPLRLSFQPYVSGGYQTIPTNNGRQNTVLKNGGMDVKYGVNESFTLDMTLIPDFGQVQSDNVILNLSPFEQQFQENRPFFTEGTELFNKAGLFYSRRVGGLPQGYFDARYLAADSGYTILTNPSSTQLYNATKFSGRNKHNVGIGIFNAVTAPMYATLRNKNGEDIRYETSPLTNYNVIVIDKAFKHRSSLTFTNTSTIRAGAARDANVSGVDLSLFDKKNIYNFTAKGVYSHLTGKGDKNGYKTYVGFDKVSGRWQWGVYNNIESKYYNPNDLGILRSPNEFSTGGYVSFYQFAANEKFNYRQYNFGFRYQSLLVPYAFQELNVEANFFHWFKNFWDLNFFMESNPTWFNDYFELRTDGRVLKRAPWAYAGFRGSSDSRKKWYISFGGGMAESPLRNDPFFNGNFAFRYRFNTKFSLEPGISVEHDNGNFGWVFFDANTDEPVIGRRILKQTVFNLNGTYNFKARMNLSLRVRHYWSNVNYTNFYDVTQKGDWKERSFEAGRDRNFNAFNIDMFYTWDFMPGSRLILAWKNALGPDVTVDATRYNKYHQNAAQVLRAPHSNEVTMKFIYFLDYNRLVKKRAS